MAVLSALLGFDSEARLIRYATEHLKAWFPYVPQRPGYNKRLRQIIESVNWTLKSQLSLQRHRGRTRPGVAARILQRILALTTAIWHNQTTQQPGPARSLTAYDH